MLTENVQRHVGAKVTIRWSRATAWDYRDYIGYPVCTLRCNGRKMASCVGHGYDMIGTVIGDWIAVAFREELLAFTQETCPNGLPGLTYSDPNYDAGKAQYDETMTIDEAETKGELTDLQRCRAIYQASSKLPTERNTIPVIDGAIGRDDMLKILHKLGLDLVRKGFKGDNETCVVVSYRGE